MNYEHYRFNQTVIAMRLTKKNFDKVLNLVANHGAVEKYAANKSECYIHFTQRWPSANKLELERGMYITSTNAGLKVYGKHEFKYRFTRIYSMPSYYSPTDNEVKIIECLNRDAEMCYGYDWICGETGLDRAEAKNAIDNLRSFGVVEYWSGLMTEDNEVAGSGFCWGNADRAEALLYRYYYEGQYANA